ncbi:methylmalonyl-CoA mutase [SAR202 cluster bacterium AC-647-N09_OGT_505m]|nr:methylmalonyl-CoA mutase [SAR202 cluster bacterium AC-647-N09_OGT_505m]
MASIGKQDWKEKVWKPATERNRERQESFETTSEMEVDVLYTPEDVANQDYGRDLGYPGSFPFTRGVQPTMYRGRVWTMRQYSGFASAEETNHRYHYILEQGQNGLSMAFDLPTQTGYDSDHPIAYSEVGKVGVPISHLEDMETVFHGIDMSKVSTSMTINATASLLMAYYIAAAKRQGVNPKDLRGTVQNDILKEYVARGTHIFPAAPSMRLVTDLFAYCASETPNWNNISISGYHMREAGCNAAQELGFTLANAIAYVQAAVDAGLDVDDFAPQITFFFVAQSNILEEVAKFRAGRRLWARLIKEKFNAQNPRSQMMRFHAQTAGVTLTAQQPDNNVVRSSMQALAAILGGTQSLHVNSKDEALALPTEESVTLSLRTQQVLAFECGLTDTVDPLAGSYYVEKLTDELERAAVSYIAHIEEMGGSVRSIEEGYQQREISDAAYKFQLEIEDGQRTVVGVNAFQSTEEETMETLRIDPEERGRQIARLQRVRASRDVSQVGATLENLGRVARGTENTMPAILACVESYCTTGEICDVLRGVFGIHKEHVVF